MAPCFQKNKMQFMPEKWQQDLGERCVTCHIQLIQQQVISLCNCPLVAHEKCFLQQFAPYITDRQEVTCLRCDHQVQLIKKYKYQWSCENFKKPTVLISFIAAILVLIAFIIMTATGVYDDVASNTVMYILVAIGVVLLSITAVCNLRKKMLFLENISVGSTNNINKEKKRGIKSIDYSEDLKSSGCETDNNKFDIL